MPPFGDVGVTYMVHLWLVGKRVVDFLIVLIEFFSLAITVDGLERHYDDTRRQKTRAPGLS